ncbi:bifunctional heptose 7-phosphate kinase/heptose 1-phosphate adenyltransferase [Roseivirga misakiensis]|uniref:Carbohydrate kinase n=1 Tax=Roseivirga misakiensis TaxID=1563681 RepID=A0A1E5T5I2_9BACT|nr:bifunctional ADP-heptose synthase [Roseivirga misakiensis]OEK06616.1 carbohydrate kinase [Roseivirga misakiensis]
MSFSNAKSLFNVFDKLKILVIGDVMVDSYIWGSVSRISPEAPVPVVLAEKKEKRLGGAANVALNVQALGATPIPCAVVGDDLDGKFFLDRLEERGIPGKGMIISAERSTTVKERVLSGAHQLLRVDTETDKELSKIEQKSLLAHIKNLLPECDAVIFEDYDKGVINKKIISETIAEANKLNIPTVVDPKKKNFLDYKGVTLFKPNLKELREGLEIECDPTNLASVKSGAKELQDRLDAKMVMVTLSEHGVFMKDNGDTHLIPAHIRQISDVSGAGDTVISIVACGLAAGLDAKRTAALANLGGGLVCEHVGVVPVNRNDLAAEADEQNLFD